MPNNPLILDYSAHSAWDTCPGLWYEKYVNRLRKRWPPGQRGDALALGSLVHSSLQQWQETHTVGIPQETVDEMTPTSECYSLAQELVWGYTRRYPEELWPLIRCEEPVRFPIQSPHPHGYCFCTGRIHSDGGYCHSCESVVKNSTPGITGLAKIDAYFHVPEPTQIELGIDGLTGVLSAGYWIHEYKTKSPYIGAGIYMQGWETNLQASYQTLALRELLRTQGKDPASVQGVLVNVLEKPRRHIPQRKCRTCNESYEFATWVPTGQGDYACPVCGVRQKLTALKEAQPQIPPVYYRIPVVRNEETLTRHREIIELTGQEMLAMREGGLRSAPWRTGKCVDIQWKRECDFFSPHTHGWEAGSNAEIYEPAPDYRGLVQLEGV